MGYYGIPIITVGAPMKKVTDGIFEYEPMMTPQAATKLFLFPLSFMGIGIKIARFGMPDPQIAASSIGALVVMWSAMVTVSKIMDCIELAILPSSRKKKIL